MAIFDYFDEQGRLKKPDKLPRWNPNAGKVNLIWNGVPDANYVSADEARCTAAGGTWNGTTCIMPQADDDNDNVVATAQPTNVQLNPALEPYVDPAGTHTDITGGGTNPTGSVGFQDVGQVEDNYTNIPNEGEAFQTNFTGTDSQGNEFSQPTLVVDSSNPGDLTNVYANNPGNVTPYDHLNPEDVGIIGNVINNSLYGRGFKAVVGNNIVEGRIPVELSSTNQLGQHDSVSKSGAYVKQADGTYKFESDDPEDEGWSLPDIDIIGGIRDFFNPEPKVEDTSPEVQTDIAGGFPPTAYDTVPVTGIDTAGEPPVTPYQPLSPITTETLPPITPLGGIPAEETIADLDSIEDQEQRQEIENQIVFEEDKKALEEFNVEYTNARDNINSLKSTLDAAQKAVDDYGSRNPYGRLFGGARKRWANGRAKRVAALDAARKAYEDALPAFNEIEGQFKEQLEDLTNDHGDRAQAVIDYYNQHGGGSTILTDTSDEPYVERLPSNNNDNDDPFKDVRITGRTDSSGKKAGDEGYKSELRERQEATNNWNQNNAWFNRGGAVMGRRKVGYNQGGKIPAGHHRMPDGSIMADSAMKYNRGGHIPMYANDGTLINHPFEREGEQFDTVEANLTPGEFIVDADSTHVFGPILERINAWEPGQDMSIGGLLSPKGEEMTIKRKMKDGAEMTVKSGKDHELLDNHEAIRSPMQQQVMMGQPQNYNLGDYVRSGDWIGPAISLGVGLLSDRAKRRKAREAANARAGAGRLAGGLTALGTALENQAAGAGAAGLRTGNLGRFGPGGYNPGAFSSRTAPTPNFSTPFQQIGQGEQIAANRKADYLNTAGDIASNRWNQVGNLATGYLGTLQSREAADIARQQQLADAQLEFEREAYLKSQGGSGKSSGYSRPFNIRWRDPDTGVEKIQAARLIDGEYYLQDPDTREWVPAWQVAGTTDFQRTGATDVPDVEAGAKGIPNAKATNNDGVPTFDFKREGEAKDYGYALRALNADHALTEIENKLPPEELASLYTGLQQWASRNSTAKITAAVINDALGDASKQEYGREISRFLQSVLRVDTGAAYTGTEIADYLSAFSISPGTVINEETLGKFQRARRQEIEGIASRTGNAAPYLLGVLDGTYSLPGWAAEEGKDIEDEADLEETDYDFSGFGTTKPTKTTSSSRRRTGPSGLNRGGLLYG